ncbi:MAG: tRNA (N(6)-L-threonylcarbamoyladenosine(37)-C(2))-methylthiotransferase MtaB [Candidatus Abyssubacteria bacterium]
MASFRIITFGCKVNQCDSQILRETLASWGFEEATVSGQPDLFVINTCTVTANADSKFHKTLRRARREHPCSAIAVTGCFVSTPQAPKLLPGADLLFHPHDMASLADFLERRGVVHRIEGHHAPMHVRAGAPSQTWFAEHTRAFLKIQDGCDCYCSYCIVPLVRPVLWSEASDKVISTMNNLAAQGYREVVLTGIHLGFFGRDSGAEDLESLLFRIEEECAIERVRLSSIEINEVSDPLLDLMARSGKFCHHLHLPLQSGDDKILSKMGRRYSAASFSARVKEIRTRIPDIGITTDVMVGYPGETEAQFQHTCRAVEELEFAKIHVFRFSPRPGTRAAGEAPRVPAAEISRRARRLIRIGEETALRFKRRFVGEVVYVLTETVSQNNAVTGLTSNYIRTEVLDPPVSIPNQILPVRITGIDSRCVATARTL